jgi:lipoate-protein ligase A
LKPGSVYFGFMSQKSLVRILISDTYNPWFNIATEDWIFNEMDSSTQTLYLWRNHDTVVIGRNQNPWSECNLKRMEDDGVKLARRVSGGGAVFHDLGNTCFTFLSPKEGYSRTQNITILLKALKHLGVDAEASGRNDLVINDAEGPRKISGSAYRETRDRAFHHGTFLISTDLTRLGNYLTPHPKKLQSKGRASVRARVMNLNEVNSTINHDRIVQTLISSFCEFHGSAADPETLNHDFLKTQPSLEKTYDQFASWDWRFGHAPQFHHQMVEYLSWGFFEIHADSEAGLFSRVEVFSDALFPDAIRDLKIFLVGKKHSRSGVEQAMLELTAAYPGLASEIAELGEWLKKQVEV